MVPPLPLQFSTRNRGPRSRWVLSHESASFRLGTTLAWNAPKTAARGGPGTPRDDEPEHIHVAGCLQDQQHRNLDHSPEHVIDEGVVAFPHREEGVPPAILQHQARQHQAEAKEGLPVVPPITIAAASAKIPEDQSHEQCGARAGGGSATPGFNVP